MFSAAPLMQTISTVELEERQGEVEMKDTRPTTRDVNTQSFTA